MCFPFVFVRWQRQVSFDAAGVPQLPVETLLAFTQQTLGFKSCLSLYNAFAHDIYIFAQWDSSKKYKYRQKKSQRKHMELGFLGWNYFWFAMAKTMKKRRFSLMDHTQCLLSGFVLNCWNVGFHEARNSVNTLASIEDDFNCNWQVIWLSMASIVKIWVWRYWYSLPFRLWRWCICFHDVFDFTEADAWWREPMDSSNFADLIDVINRIICSYEKNIKKKQHIL